MDRVWNVVRLKNLATFFYTQIFTLLIFVLVRILEFLYLLSIETEGLSIEILLFKSIFFDSLFVLGLSVILLIFYFILFLFLKIKTALTIIKVTNVIIGLWVLSLTQFYLTNGVILNGSVLAFSWEELSLIIGAEISPERIIFWSAYFVIPPLLIFLLFFITPRLVRQRVFLLPITVLYLVGLGSLVFSKGFTQSRKHFSTEFQYHIGNCKPSFFIESIWKIKTEQAKYSLLNKSEFSKNLVNFYSTRPQHNFYNPIFPLLHNEPYKNVLGSYFKSSNIKPNIVFVLCESLAGSYSGRKTKLANLTPFIDSLIDKSLYWENFFSHGERTYGVIPNVLGSLPFGTSPKGFMVVDEVYSGGKDYPNITSVVQLLKDHNYRSALFYGGWSFFDKMSLFLEKAMHIDTIIEESNFDSTRYQKLKTNDGSVVWGHNDKALFNTGFEIMDKHNFLSPYINIYLTITFHSPYNIVDKSYTTNEFIEERLSNLKLKREDVVEFGNNQLGSIFFADDALREFFNRYKERNDYNNTIFVVLGDHGGYFDKERELLDHFHVPLVIFSPLLKFPGYFKGVSFQSDITPSLLALLEGNFNMEFPKNKPWVGTGLDTSSVFNANKASPLSIFSTEFPVFMYKDLILTADNLYRFNENLNCTEVKDQKLYEEVNSYFESYKIINNYVVKKDRVWPGNNLNLSFKN